MIVSLIAFGFNIAISVLITGSDEINSRTFMYIGIFCLVLSFHGERLFKRNVTVHGGNGTGKIARQVVSPLCADGLNTCQEAESQQKEDFLHNYLNVWILFPVIDYMVGS